MHPNIRSSLFREIICMAIAGKIYGNLSPLYMRVRKEKKLLGRIAGTLSKVSKQLPIFMLKM